MVALFPDFDWGAAYYSTNVEDEFIPITEQTRQADNQMATFVAVANKAPRKYLPYLMVNMIGIRR